MTEKIYETRSHLANHTATVLSCEKAGDLYDLVLDRTAFFPEGGGQPSDVGTIDGAAVSAVTVADGTVHHTVDREFPVGATVECAVDMSVRFPRMQCHSGEHVVSGIIHNLHGFNNVGFHMGSKDVTLDIDGELGDDELREVERLANKAVAENLPIRVIYPENGDDYDYRSKMEITEGLRLVEIPGYDLCACCAPHVERTGEIGIIKLLEHIRYKGGTRIHMLCGFSALADYHEKFAELSRISELLSAKKNECADAVEALQKQLAEQEYKTRAIVKTAILADAERAPATDGNTVFFEPAEFASGLRDLANAVLPKCGGIVAAFAGSDGDYAFVMASTAVDLRAASGEIREKLKAKGGGSPEMITGKSGATADEIRRFFGV